MLDAGLLQSYSLWSGRSDDCSFLLKRLGILPIQIYDESFDMKPQVSLKLDIRATDALLALCNYCEFAERDLVPLRALLALFVGAASRWIVNPNVNVVHVLERVGQAILISSAKAAVLKEAQREKILDIAVGTIIEWSQRLDESLPHDPGYVRQCIYGVIRAITDNHGRLNNMQKSVLLRRLCELLDGGAFDLRALLADAPTDFRLEEVVSEHFKCTLGTLKILGALLPDVVDPEVERLRTLIVDYTQALCGYLINSVSHEPFLCSILQASMSLYPPLCLMKTESESVLAILRSFKYFQCYANFHDLFPTVAEVLVATTSCKESNAEDIYLYIGAVKSVLYTLTIKGEITDYPDTLRTMRDGGAALGKFISALLASDRLFCESFASNLVVEFPISSRSNNFNEESEAIGSLAEVLGSVAVSARDEAIGKICLSSLLTQFNRVPAVNIKEKEYFLKQFAKIGAVCTGAIFNSVVDTLTALLKNGNLPLSVLSYWRTLAKSVGADPVKRDVLLITLMRYFIELGVSLLGNQKGEISPSNDMTCLLETICTCLSTYPKFELCGKTTYVDIFQEFWMIVVLFGYIPSLEWHADWSNFIPIVSQSSPVLIKSRDRLQSPGTTFSQVVLGQSASPSLRSHLGSYLSNMGVASLRSLTFAQCLWLLAIYYAEKGKLQAGFIAHISAYIKNDVVELLGLDILVTDLISTLIARWADPSRSVGFVQLARLLMELLCDIQPRTHRSALKLLQQHFIDDRAVYSDREIWQIIAQKLTLMFHVCRAEIGSPSLEGLPVELTRDPTAARIAFHDTLGLARRTFGLASKDCPNHFFRFAHTRLYGTNSSATPVNVDGGDRDVVLLELVRLLMPSTGFMDEKHSAEYYVASNTLLHRNAEGFVHQEITSSMPFGSNYTNQIVDLLCQDDPAQVKQGIRAWLTFLDRSPLLSTRLIVALTAALPLTIMSTNSSFQRKSPLRGHLPPGPSKTINTQKEANSIIAKAVLLDFLSEQMQLDCINSQSTLSLYLVLVDRLLSIEERTFVSLSRFVRLRIFLFAFECINGGEGGTVLADMVREHLYQAMLASFSHQVPYMESPAICRQEELNIIRDLIEYLMRDRRQEGNKRIGLLAAAFAALLHYGHVVNTLVWMNSPLSDRAPNVYESKKEFMTEIASISLGLYMRLVEIVKFAEATAPLMIWRERCLRDYQESSELVSFALDRQLPFTYEASMYSAPLFLPTALYAIKRATAEKKSPTATDQRLSSIALLNLAVRSLEAASPADLYYYIPQLVQTLRYDRLGFSERAILHIAKVSALFAHQVIWNMRANAYIDEAGTIPDPVKDRLDAIEQNIVSQFSAEAEDFFLREFAFFEKVTNISGSLKPYVKKEKWEKKAKIDEELAKIKVDPGVYLPSSPEFTVIDIDYDSGRPLQSHAKAPFLATFKVRGDGEQPVAIWQSVIFKVGDDCRQDVLALQLISLAKTLLEVHSLPLYLFPYRVIATASGCGVIEVIPKSISRDQLGREKINSLYEYFVFRFGGESSQAFHEARLNFVRSMAAYSVVCYLLAIKDRHNGNIMIDDAGHIIHIDFGFILDIAPGGITFENAPFKLTSEMLQVMGGKDEGSPYFCWFRELCVQAFLVLRNYASAFLHLVEGMADSGLPCFKGGERTLRNLRNRFRLDLDAQAARNLMYDLVYKSCENVRTAMYDRFQLSQNGIPY